MSLMKVQSLNWNKISSGTTDGAVGFLPAPDYLGSEAEGRGASLWGRLQAGANFLFSYWSLDPRLQRPFCPLNSGLWNSWFWGSETQRVSRPHCGTGGPPVLKLRLEHSGLFMDGQLWLKIAQRREPALPELLWL